MTTKREASLANVDGFEIGGKTGTAKKQVELTQKKRLIHLYLYFQSQGKVCFSNVR